ncbi:MAG: Crp/Fnr family transcriptional regulator [Lachnospiraceae bacterium]|nr:Crp/Fnr family transcriptional regulator [Lachnospiraceae bacterium]
MEKYYPVLDRCAMFQGIGKESVLAMLKCMGAKVLSYNQGETIFAEGDLAEDIGIVLSGSAQIVKIDYFGNRSIMANVVEGEIFGESFACSGVDTLPVNVIATKNCQIMIINALRIISTCSNACEFHRQIIFNLLKVVATKNLVFNQKIEVTSKRSTREKLMTYLLIQAKNAGSNEFTIPFDRQELADYLEVDRSGLSAEISKLRKEGVLECEKGRFVLNSK